MTSILHPGARCDYCPWPAVAVLELRQSRWRTMVFLPVRYRHVCQTHVTQRICEGYL